MSLLPTPPRYFIIALCLDVTKRNTSRPIARLNKARFTNCLVIYCVRVVGGWSQCGRRYLTFRYITAIIVKSDELELLPGRQQDENSELPSC